jgi:hypothetical protein
MTKAISQAAAPAQPQVAPVKPGYMTTEFWLTFIAMLPTIAVSFGLVPRIDEGKWDDVAAKVAGGLVGVVAIYGYLRARTAVKTGSISATETTVDTSVKTGGSST